MKRTLLLFCFLICIRVISVAQVTLLFPDNNEELTDIAVSFKAKITTNGSKALYLSRNQDFSGEVITKPARETRHQGQRQFDFYYWMARQGKVTTNDKFILAPGTWYWRVSGNNGATFSETRRLVVNDSKPLTPPEWDISPEKPMFHMRLRSDLLDHATNGDVAGQLRKIIPDHLKEFVVLDLGHSFHWLADEMSLYEYSKIFDDLGYKYFYDMGSHSWLGRIASLGEMEKIFRDLKHCVGASTPEIFYYIYAQEEDRSMFDGALELCRKYGKKFLQADMNWKWSSWQRFNYIYYDTFKERQYADYYIPQVKTTDPWGAHTNVSALQGMKYTNMVSDIGIWTDLWSWGDVGQVNNTKLGEPGENNQDLYPFIQNIKQYIYGMTFGSTTFGLEYNLQWHWQTAEPNDHYYRYLEPFISAVVQEQIIPSEKSIRDNFNVFVDTEFMSSQLNTTEPLTYVRGNIWGDFFRSTYGISDDIPHYNENSMAGGVEIINAAYLEIIPNTDRYPSGIPFLPKPNVPAPTLDGRRMEVTKISDLNTKAEVDARLNKHYRLTGNEAYAQKIDKSIFVFNTYENHDIKQNYSVDIGFAGIESLSGDVNLLNYVVGKEKEDGVTMFFQTNGYVKNTSLVGGKYLLPTYNSVLKFKCNSRPTLASDELSAITQNWNAGNGILTVEVDHTTAGAVNFTLKGEQVTTPTPSDKIVYLKGNNNRYVSSENGVKPMNCNRSAIASWEKFNWINLDNGKIAFKGSNGKYVSSEDGLKSMTCNRSAIGYWERFTPEPLGGNVYAFKASNGKYISSENGSLSMTCNRNVIGSWEKFFVDEFSGKNSSKNNFTVFFNSKSKTVNVMIQDKESVSSNINVFNMNGIRVLTTKIRANISSDLDVSNLIEGFYIIKTDKGHVQKIVVK